MNILSTIGLIFGCFCHCRGKSVYCEQLRAHLFEPSFFQKEVATLLCSRFCLFMLSNVANSINPCALPVLISDKRGRLVSGGHLATSNSAINSHMEPTLGSMSWTSCCMWWNKKRNKKKKMLSNITLYSCLFLLCKAMYLFL